MSSMVIPAFGEHGLDPVEHNADLLLQVVGRLAGFGIEADAPRDVQRVAYQHAVAERTPARAWED